MAVVGGTPMPPFQGQLKPEEVWDVVHYVQSLRVDAHVAKLTASGMKKSDEEDARSRIWASLSGAARHGQIDKQLVQGTKVSQVALAERGGRGGKDELDGSGTGAVERRTQRTPSKARF